MNELEGRGDLASAIADPIYRQFQSEMVKRIQRDQLLELEVMGNVWKMLSEQTLNLLPKYVSDRPVLSLNMGNGDSYTALYLCYHSERPLIANPLFDACLKELMTVLYAATGISWICTTSDYYGVNAFELEDGDLRCWILRREEE